jgi:hypothetical protein
MRQTKGNPMSAIQKPNPYRFSVGQYHELDELGLLNNRTELLNGIITDIGQGTALVAVVVIEVPDLLAATRMVIAVLIVTTPEVEVADLLAGVACAIRTVPVIEVADTLTGPAASESG